MENGDDLTKKAIRAALENNWGIAIKINKDIVKDNPTDVAANNRLARAYWENDQISLAKKTYKKTLAIDKYNPIAQKNLKRLPSSSKANGKKKFGNPTHHIFLEEPGKTKMVKLVRLTSPEILACIDCGDMVSLTTKKRIVSVDAEDGTYLGIIPEDLSRKLIKLIKGGNQYEAAVRKVDRQELEIIIRETYRDEKFRKQPSFISSSVDFIPPVPEKEINQGTLEIPSEE